MKIEVILTPKELPSLAARDLRETACVVFDILRATSAFVTALQNGAKGIIPVGEISEALEIKKNQPEMLLAGERNGLKIRAQKWDRHLACQPENGQAGSLSHYSPIDFDFGNSPREFTREKVGGKTIVSTTTNGTRAFRACANAKMILAGSFLNLSATAKFILQQKFQAVLLVCAGTGENAALEDILAAGAICEILSGDNQQKEFSDSAQIAFHAFENVKSNLAEAVFKSENARRLLAIPELRDDVAFCLQRNIYPIVAAMNRDGFIALV